jgi:hypothetical protein
MHIINESPLNECILHASVRFARLFRSQLFSEEHSLFTFIISSGYRRSLTPVLESFHTRGNELSRELGLSERASFSLTTRHVDFRREM